MTQATEAVLVERRGAVALVTLNRPERLNASDRELHRAVARLWTEVGTDPQVGAIVLTGAGRAFSAGGDAHLLQAMVEDESLRREVLDEAAALVHAMLACPVPIVSAVNGPAVGLGWSLASASDLVVMADTAFFSDPHVMIGLVAADGGALTLPLLSGLLRAKEFVLLGDRVPAADALRLGLANRVVPTDSVVDVALGLAERLAAYPRQAVRETRHVLNLGLQRALDTGLDRAIAAEYASFDTPEFQRGLARMLDR
jgi:enoyl-CoA hydratase